MKCYGIIPERKLWVKVGIIIFGVYTIYSSLINHNLFYFPFGIVVILATFSDRKHIISQEGVDIVYTICGFQFHNIWNWSEINTIHMDSISSKPNVELHIGKDITTRRFILSKNDANKVITIISKINSKIYIAEWNKK
ncbi:hypothetical protein [Fusobacterium ulcerans]|uniref:hypothetical protein n=1 Tax=Fusobacterium ulcerans TaxID=861 RepID=UPI001D09E6FF|nr:hypothetical protein [Fusobacterium ulcerans]MCB8564538.1 hypothetical protein [Fusobacterium ulcerans]MCB8648709.1 hypothetical protein [Fusobacterium ulcerans]